MSNGDCEGGIDSTDSVYESLADPCFPGSQGIIYVCYEDDVFLGPALYHV